MSVTLRRMLGELPAYVPGRTVPGAIKLASNETPYPPLPHVTERIADAALSANRYPDTGSGELVAAIAAKFGVDPRQVAVGCGSVSLCTQLVQAAADAGDEVLYAWRSFEAYPIITAVSGASAVQVPLRDHVHDLAAMAERITGKTRLIFVCNPNNPTATAVRRDELVAFLRRVPEDVVVALDEAYREFVTDPDVPDGTTLLDEHPNVVVLRTFSKAYGLAGLRVGYAIAADPAIATALGQTQVPFAVTTVAQQAALASLEPEAEQQLMQRVREIVAERSRVRDELIDLGYDIPPSEANFVWFPLGERATEWASACADRKLIVRPFAGVSGGAPGSGDGGPPARQGVARGGVAAGGVRVTIGTPQENDQLLQAAGELVG